jgi:Tol biopolymer transport system component
VSVSANRLVFEDYSCSQTLALGLHIAKADGSDPVQLTPAGSVGDQGDDEQASLAPDGRSVVFVRVTRGATGGLFIADAASGAVRRLTPDWGDVGHPRWSPDGRSILFTQDSPQGDQAVYVVAATGGEPRALTHFPVGDLAFQAAWSPDGSQITFVFWDRQDHNALWVMAADGSQQRALWVGDHSQADWPDWGP